MRPLRFFSSRNLLIVLLIPMNIVLGQWLQTSGPYGGTISSFATVDTSLFAGTASAGVFRSTDSGANWDSVNSGLTNLGIQSLAVSGTNLYVGTRGGVFRSTDNGTNWTAANTGLGNTDATALAVSGTNLFAGTAGGGVFRSTDNGASWDSVNIGLTDRYISTLAADIFPAEPHDDTLVFAGTQGGHAFRSIDNGESWVDVSAGLLGTAVGDLEFQGYNVFSATANGVFRMNVYDAAWTQVNVGLTHTFVYWRAPPRRTRYGGF